MFANLNLMHMISTVMDSKPYVDNFQPVFVAKTAKFHVKNRVENLTIFEKQIFDCHDWYSVKP